MAVECKLLFILILVVVWQAQITQQRTSMPNTVSNKSIKINGEFIIHQQEQQNEQLQQHHHQKKTTRNIHQKNIYWNFSNVETNSNSGRSCTSSICKHKRHSNITAHMGRRLFSSSSDDWSTGDDNPNSIHDIVYSGSNGNTDIIINRHQKRHRHHHSYRNFNGDTPEYRNQAASLLTSTTQLKHYKYFIENEQAHIGSDIVNRDDSLLNLHWPVKKEAIMEGDLVLGGLMMVHSREDTIMCGPIMPQGGIQALEAMLYTLDRINRDGLLPNVTIGAHILDDCDRDSYGLEMAVDFIKG